MIRNIQSIQPMQGSCQHWCTPFFWTPLREIDLQRCNPSVAVLFARDGYWQRRGMQTVRRVGSGVDDSQSVELRDRAGMATTVLTLQQFRLALPGLAVTLAGRIAHFVGWVSLRSTHPTNRLRSNACRRCVRHAWWRVFAMWLRGTPACFVSFNLSCSWRF